MLTAMLLLATVSAVAPPTPAQAQAQAQVIDDVFPEIGGSPCVDGPATEWDDPACDDYHLDTALIEAAARKDQSAISLLQRRYGQMVNFRERFRIAGALLHRVPDDSDIWRELARYAGEAVRFAPHGDDPNPDLEAYCDLHGYDASSYHAMTIDAFCVALEDARSRPILVKALAADDLFLMQAAIVGFMEQHDESGLSLIEKRFSELGKVPSELVIALAYFHCEAADRVAAKYIAQDDAERYEQIRHEEQK